MFALEPKAGSLVADLTFAMQDGQRKAVFLVLHANARYRQIAETDVDGLSSSCINSVFTFVQYCARAVAKARK